MVFMGSEKFPQENDFDAFIKVIFNTYYYCYEVRAASADLVKDEKQLEENTCVYKQPDLDTRRSIEI